MFNHKALQINTFTKFRKSRIKSHFTKKKYIKKNMSLFIIKACQNIILTESQLTTYLATVNKTLRQYLSTKNKYKIWLNVYPHISMTTKPKEVRMGGGKGKITSWGCRVKSGQPLLTFSYFNPDFELTEMEDLLFKILKQKFSIKIKVIKI